MGEFIYKYEVIINNVHHGGYISEDNIMWSEENEPYIFLEGYGIYKVIDLRFSHISK